MGHDWTKLSFRYKRMIELDYFVPTFIHAKNCFNTLALFKGIEFVQQKLFDRFRACILENADWEVVLRPSDEIPYNIFSWLMSNTHGHEHAVVIYACDDKMRALSVLYGNSVGLFELGVGYRGDQFSCAVICDFKNSDG